MSPLTAMPARLRALARPVPGPVISTARLAPARVRHGRPGILALRCLATAIQAEAVLHSGAGAAPSPAPWPESRPG